MFLTAAVAATILLAGCVTVVTPEQYARMRGGPGYGAPAGYGYGGPPPGWHPQMVPLGQPLCMGPQGPVYDLMLCRALAQQQALVRRPACYIRGRPADPRLCARM